MEGAEDHNLSGGWKEEGRALDARKAPEMSKDLGRS